MRSSLAWRRTGPRGCCQGCYDDPAANPNDKPPRTVKEMVDKSAADTKENAAKAGAAVEGAAKSAESAVQKAGAAISNAAKKTWTCLTSLFGDC